MATEKVRKARRRRYRWGRNLRIWNADARVWRSERYTIGTRDTILSYEIAGTPLARRLLKEETY